MPRSDPSLGDERGPRRAARVLAFSDAWPPRVGGSGAYFAALVSRVPGLVALAPKSGQPYDDPPFVRRVYRFNHFLGGVAKLKAAIRELEFIAVSACWALLGTRPQVVICGQLLFGGLIGLLARRLRRAPYVVVVYGEELGIWMRGGLARRRLTALVLDRAALVIAISRDTYDLCRRAGVETGRLAVLNPSVNSAAYAPRGAGDVRQRLGIPEGSIVLMVGRLIERKGFDKAIAALPVMLAARPDIVLVIAGEGPLGERLREVARRHQVQPRVRFVGQVDHETLVQLYEACELFLLPNRTLSNGDVEGFGIVFLEANILGRAVIGGDSGGSRDAIANGVSGMLVDGNDEQAIARSVIELLNDPQRRACQGEQGRARVLRQFTDEALGRAFAELLVSRGMVDAAGERSDPA